MQKIVLKFFRKRVPKHSSKLFRRDGHFTSASSVASSSMFAQPSFYFCAVLMPPLYFAISFKVRQLGHPLPPEDSFVVVFWHSCICHPFCSWCFPHTILSIPVFVFQLTGLFPFCEPYSHLPDRIAKYWSREGKIISKSLLSHKLEEKFSKGKESKIRPRQLCAIF